MIKRSAQIHLEGEYIFELTTDPTCDIESMIVKQTNKQKIKADKKYMISIIFCYTKQDVFIQDILNV